MAVPLAEQKKLLLRSGNRCAFDDCRRELTSEEGSDTVLLGEIAHIVAERPDGPRGQSAMTAEERNRYENLILLCNIHHQLVDSAPEHYSVARLLAIREAHERWVAQRLSVPPTSPVPAMVRDVLHSTLLPVVEIPRFIYGAPFAGTDPEAVRKSLGPLRGSEAAPFVLNGGMLYAFQRLDAPGNPFQPLIGSSKPRREPSKSWWGDPDRERLYVQLLNRVLNKLTGRRALHLDKDHHRYYFAPSNPGQPLAVPYTPLNQSRTERNAVWQPISKKTGQPRPYWLHLAVQLRFQRFSDVGWALAIRPAMRVTVDGVRPLASEKIGAKVTRRISRLFNYDLLGEMQFWRDYLSEGRPRIILSFGSKEQRLVIGTTLASGEIEWPGIPAKYAKPFRNVEFEEDLFTLAELHDSGATDDDDWEDGGEDDTLTE